ncbi:hypothetical protein [Oleiharenicola lentus]|uniref:hypothetical protein n=1 Tax=Oleiharenicola lentus TaxID=2508720 RepID=UPI003F67DADD
MNSQNKVSDQQAQEHDKLEQQKKAARAPQIPAKEAPKDKPAPPSKPIWDKPDSS